MANDVKIEDMDMFELQHKASQLRALETQRLASVVSTWFKSKFTFPKMELDVA